MTDDLQRDMFTRRWRRQRTPTAKEYQTQIALIERLKLQGNDAVVWWHTPNGELRDKRVAARLKAMGVMPGVADLTFIWHVAGKLCVLFLELKREGERQTEEQIHFEKLVTQRGCDYQVASNIDAAVVILKQRGILP